MSSDPTSQALAHTFAQLRAGQADHALKSVQALLDRAPDEPRAHALHARILAAQGETQAAWTAVAQALAIDANCAPALVEQAALARAAGDRTTARDALRRLLGIAPNHADFWFDLGQLNAELGDPVEARKALDRALVLAPAHADAHFQRANLDARHGRHDAAIAGYRQALGSRPGWYEALANLGEALLSAGRNDDAFAVWQQATTVSPNQARAWDGLARAANLTRRTAESLRARERCAELDGGGAAWSLLGAERARNGDLPGARDAFQRVLDIDPKNLAARWAMFQYPADAVRADWAAEQTFRHQWLEGLAWFEAQDLHVRQPAEVIAALTIATEFEVHYLGDAMVKEQRRYGALLQRLMQRAFAERPPPTRRPRNDGRRRIGFCSAMMRTHTVTKLFASLPSALDRSRWQVCGFHPANLINAGTESWRQQCEVFVHGEHDLGWWVDTLRAEDLDLLVFPDIGMHPIVQGLASLRFAPVQVMLWGHPQTSGRSTIDWFLTADAMESPDGERFYSERLHRLPGLGTCYAPPTATPVMPSDFASRDPAAVHYFIAQQSMKLRPVFDEVYARIAAALPAAMFHFVPSPYRGPTEALRSRLRSAFSKHGLDFARHCGWFGFVDEAQFLGIGANADVNLDSIGWSGGNTTLEILWHHTPTVTLPGELMRSRHTMAMLQRLELPMLIARDVDDYVRIAVELGRSPDLRAELRALISERKHRLYNDTTAPRAFATFADQVRGG